MYENETSIKYMSVYLSVCLNASFSLILPVSGVEARAGVPYKNIRVASFLTLSIVNIEQYHFNI